VFPLVHGEAATRVGIAVSAVFLLLVSGSLPLVGLGGVAYAWTAGVLGAVLVVVAVRGAWRGAGRSWARWVFRFSLLHLVALFSALLVFRR
jgi:Polyprenyltransferase (cytochrome oxidase assembly factor)